MRGLCNNSFRIVQKGCRCFVKNVVELRDAEGVV